MVPGNPGRCRRRIFVDLFAIFRQALRAGAGSYSLKDLEALFDFARTAEVRTGNQAIVDYERWLEGKDPRILADIAKYNEETTPEEAAEESGWKLVHGDVFRPPAGFFGPMFLSVFVGSGMQVLAMSFTMYR